ncbi:hypothetical protein ACFLZG_04980 [Thermodesulfobacteriota bacterium]
MDVHQEEGPSVRGKSLNQRQLTVMFIRSVGKIRSFKVSRRIIFWSSLFFLAYILISLYIINNFIDLRYRYDIQSKKFGQMEGDLDKKEKKFIQTKQHVAILEDYIQNIHERRSQEVVPVKSENADAKIVDKIVEDVTDEIQEKEEPLTIVNIENLVIRKENSGMRVDFRLVNLKPGENAIEGYIHIIAMDKNNTSPPEWNYPNDKLKNGLPINFRRGQPFLIQRFKPYHRKFIFNSDSESPTAIKVLVYDRPGTLILKKEFEVSNVS